MPPGSLRKRGILLIKSKWVSKKMNWHKELQAGRRNARRMTTNSASKTVSMRSCWNATRRERWINRANSRRQKPWIRKPSLTKPSKPSKRWQTWRKIVPNILSTIVGSRQSTRRGYWITKMVRWLRFQAPARHQLKLNSKVESKKSHQRIWWKRRFKIVVSLRKISTSKKSNQ